tara:strand:+ start:1883 stop:3229 length:1347 start_codon:yes stop_codon:yes gene_type:complete
MRYLPLTKDDRMEILDVIGIKKIDDLFEEISHKVDINPKLELPNHMTELEVERHMSKLANKNMHADNSPFFIGGGSYKHHIPASVDHIIQRSEFLTSYTPYQPEISQGTLQYLYEFQTQVSLLTGMDLSNASMYDGSTAAAEAVSMAKRITKKDKVVLSNSLHPHYASVIKTVSGISEGNLSYCAGVTNYLEELENKIDEDTACVVVQNPDFFGACYDLTKLAAIVHSKGALLIVVVTEVLSLGLMKPPGDMGADIVACEGQSLGNPMNFGGPYVGLLSTKKDFLRQLPGRIVGESQDVDGRKGFVLTLSAREQHIRREKATSNICTNSGLCSLAFTIHLTLLGEIGFKNLAQLNHQSALSLRSRLSKIPGVEAINSTFFNEFTMKLPIKSNEFVELMSQKGILAGIPVTRLLPEKQELENHLIITSTETNTQEDLDIYLNEAKEILI